MWQVVAEAGAGYMAMHMQGTPQTMQSNPVYGDVVAEVREFFVDRLDRLHEFRGEERTGSLDVGIGSRRSTKNSRTSATTSP